MTAPIGQAFTSRALHLAGRIGFFGENRYARHVFGRVIALHERIFGIPSRKQWTTLSSGTRLLCDLHDNIESHLYYLRSYAGGEIRFLTNHLERGDVFLDVGAHSGLFSIEIAKAVGPSGRVIAVEPAQDSRDMLARNAEANGVQSIVEVLPLALGAKSDELSLRESARRPGDRGMRSLFGTGSEVARVPVVAFDDLVQGGRLDLRTGLHGVKIDAEGADADVLMGMRGTLDQYRPRVLLIEVSPSVLEGVGRTGQEIYGLMREAGYRPLPGDSGGYVKRRTPINIAFVPASGLEAQG